MDISVNGTVVAAGLPFTGDGDWTSWRLQSVTANLSAGTNTIRATGTTANGGPNLDHLEVS
jgi:endoglucanase